MSGGGASQPAIQQIQTQVPFQPVPTNDSLGVASGPQFGPTATLNPFVAGNAPDWATGYFAMPWWGLDPMSQPLTQQEMMYQAPPKPAPIIAPQERTANVSDPTPRHGYNAGGRPSQQTERSLLGRPTEYMSDDEFSRLAREMANRQRRYWDT
ncbi:hypothetical protein TPMD04_35 [Thiohalocapsa phage LS06-2018-MD04]|jgi:hypothetical protein|nr:hypothetical protein TPMD04_35 [Thiohalocapsa phage LS06-2018-MD04]